MPHIPSMRRVDFPMLLCHTMSVIQHFRHGLISDQPGRKQSTSGGHRRPSGDTSRVSLHHLAGPQSPSLLDLGSPPSETAQEIVSQLFEMIAKVVRAVATHNPVEHLFLLDISRTTVQMDDSITWRSLSISPPSYPPHNLCAGLSRSASSPHFADRVIKTTRSTFPCYVANVQQLPQGYLSWWRCCSSSSSSSSRSSSSSGSSGSRKSSSISSSLSRSSSSSSTVAVVVVVEAPAAAATAIAATGKS